MTRPFERWRYTTSPLINRSTKLPNFAQEQKKSPQDLIMKLYCIWGRSTGRALACTPRKIDKIKHLLKSISVLRSRQELWRLVVAFMMHDLILGPKPPPTYVNSAQSILRSRQGLCTIVLAYFRPHKTQSVTLSPHRIIHPRISDQDTYSMI